MAKATRKQRTLEYKQEAERLVESGQSMAAVASAAVKSRGGERRVKSPGHDPGQVSVGKTSASKPYDDGSLIYQELSKPEVTLFSGTSPPEA